MFVSRFGEKKNKTIREEDGHSTFNLNLNEVDFRAQSDKTKANRNNSGQDKADAVLFALLSFVWAKLGLS